MSGNILQSIPDDFIQRATLWGYKLVLASAIFLSFLVGSVLIKKIISELAHPSDLEKKGILALLGNLAKISVLIFGLVTALGTLGINVSALVAGLGLTGFALGFAFRDALSNVLAGVMILMYHPFRRGDFVSVMGLEGKVAGIDLRYTMLQSDTKTFLIPNSILLTNPISLTKASV